MRLSPCRQRHIAKKSCGGDADNDFLGHLFQKDSEHMEISILRNHNLCSVSSNQLSSAIFPVRQPCSSLPWSFIRHDKKDCVLSLAGKMGSFLTKSKYCENTIMTKRKTTKLVAMIQAHIVNYSLRMSQITSKSRVHFAAFLEKSAYVITEEKKQLTKE